MKGKYKQRHLTYISLFAVLMLFLGPLTTQIIAMGVYSSQKSTSHQHHQQLAQQVTEQHHAHTEMPVDTNAGSIPSSHHNMSACGYCDLLHSPVLFTYTPIVAHAPPHFQQHPPYPTKLIVIPLYNSPLSRAPPSLS